jgi:HPt (histidine-containing phosphotransfer) domain-containing protein
MRSLLSRLAFWWAALAIGLSLLLPSPLGTWVAALAVAGAALSLLAGQGGRHSHPASKPAPASAIEEGGLLETAAMVVRSAAHAHDLPEALHGAARILFQELGADGLVTGRLDESGALLRLDRFADQSTRCPAPPRESMSTIATEAVTSQRVSVSPEGACAVPVLREGHTVAWLEFKRVEMAIAGSALMRLLDLVRLELSAVAERSVWLGSGKSVMPDRASPAQASEATGVSAPARSTVRRPAPNESRALLTRYVHPGAARADGDAADGAHVLDRNALNRLHELDPSGVNRLLERVAKAFEASATRLIPKLREGARAGDLAAVQQVAHTLKSASASIGALKLSRLCADVETQARAEDGEGLASRVKAMVAEIDIVLSVLRSLPVPRK